MPEDSASHNMSRRDFFKSAAGMGAAGLAGCLSDEGFFDSINQDGVNSGKGSWYEKEITPSSNSLTSFLGQARNFIGSEDFQILQTGGTSLLFRGDEGPLPLEMDGPLALSGSRAIFENDDYVVVQDFSTEDDAISYSKKGEEWRELSTYSNGFVDSNEDEIRWIETQKSLQDSSMMSIGLDKLYENTVCSNESTTYFIDGSTDVVYQISHSDIEEGVNPEPVAQLNDLPNIEGGPDMSAKGDEIAVQGRYGLIKIDTESNQKERYDDLPGEIQSKRPVMGEELLAVWGDNSQSGEEEHWIQILEGNEEVSEDTFYIQEPIDTVEASPENMMVYTRFPGEGSRSGPSYMIDLKTGEKQVEGTDLFHRGPEYDVTYSDGKVKIKN